MYNLPKKKQVLVVEPTDYPGVRLKMKTVPAERVFGVMEECGISMGDIESGMASLSPEAASRLVAFFGEQVVGADGLHIEGEQFNPEDTDHLASVPIEMAFEGAAAVLEYPFLSPEMGKDSAERDGPSPKDSTRPERSPGVKPSFSSPGTGSSGEE